MIISFYFEVQSTFKMSNEYIKDIKEIKSMMAERSKFLSLSGLSGILAGIYALIGALVAYRLAYNSDSIAYQDIMNRELTPIITKLLLVAGVVFVMALSTAYYFTSQKAKKLNAKMWSPATLKLLKSFSVPLLTGGLVIFGLLWRGDLLLISTATLIFYGLALYSASHYTYRDIGALGIAEILVGLVSLGFPGYGLYFWAFGFGVLHVIYGTIMYFKYDRA